MQTGRVNYYRLKSIIKKVEDFEIKAVLLPDFYTTLKEKLQDGDALTDDEKMIIKMIAPAVVNLTIARAVNEHAATINDEGFLQFDNTRRGESLDTKMSATPQTLVRLQAAAERDGRTYLDILKKHLDANLDIFTAYRDDSTRVIETEPYNANAENTKFYNGL
jgi:hypothetical protein